MTVSKDIAKAAEEAQASTNDLIEIMSKVVKAADISVVNTPNLLPILKQAGVVDSAAKDFISSLKEFCAAPLINRLIMMNLRLKLPLT